MTGEQLRAARGLVRWSARELAEASGVGWATIQRLESKDGPLRGYEQTHEALRTALEAQGVQFLDTGDVALGAGVALKRKDGDI